MSSDFPEYEKLIFKIPVESESYKNDSDFVIRQITAILDVQKLAGNNRIIINTNLRSGLPLKDINKIAGPVNIPKPKGRGFQ